MLRKIVMSGGLLMHLLFFEWLGLIPKRWFTDRYLFVIGLVFYGVFLAVFAWWLMNYDLARSWGT